MSDVVFVTPNFTGNLEDEAVGTLLLTSILHGKGISSNIVQYSEFGDPSRFFDFCECAVSSILAYNPKVVSFYCRCDVYHIVLTLARRIKTLKPLIFIVLGGPQADISAYDTVRCLNYIDFVCCGEGEKTIYPFFSSLLDNSPDYTIPGLVYKCNGVVHMNPRPGFMENLDDLPFVDYSLLSNIKLLTDSRYKWFPIDVGRGCPFGCTYCSTKTFWGRKYRLKSPQRIIDEIKLVNRQFGTTSFAFLHDMFTMNRRQIIEVCRLLKQLDFSITWKCSARIDCIDEELIDIMYDAGLRIIFVGIETGSARMQKMVNKNLKLEKLYPILSYLAEKKISIISSFIYGFPEETEEDLSQTIQAISSISSLKNIIIQAHLCTFLPGTEMAKIYSSQMSFTNEYSDITGTIGINECMDLIKAYPSLFQHLLEYKTELRSRLRHFRVFVRMFRTVSHAYKYISTKFDPASLIKMYYDFVNCNYDLLNRIESLPIYLQVKEILKNDRFLSLFSDDENYSVLCDYCRLKYIQISDAVLSGRVITDVICFDPACIESSAKIDEFTRGVYLISCTVNKDGAVSMVVKGRK